MRLISANVNGIRAAARRGGLEWIAEQRPDVLALQEVRADDAQLRDTIDASSLSGWTICSSPGSVTGRAGVAVVCPDPPEAVRHQIGPAEFDDTGRWIEVDLATAGAPITIASTYVHTGQADTPREDEKLRFLGAIGRRMDALAASGRHTVIAGDFNVAHRPEDLKNWKGNRGKAGFLPEEQAHLDHWLDALDYHDVVRERHGPGPGPYTWWSWRGKAFDNDAGWRIDYQFASGSLVPLVTSVHVGRAAAYDARWSDHAAVIVDYDLQGLDRQRSQ